MVAASVCGRAPVAAAASPLPARWRKYQVEARTDVTQRQANAACLPGTSQRSGEVRGEYHGETEGDASRTSHSSGDWERSGLGVVV